MKNLLVAIMITVSYSNVYSQNIANRYEYVFPNGNTNNTPVFSDFTSNEFNEYYCTFNLPSHPGNVGVVKLDSLGGVIWSKLLTGGVISEIDGITMASNGDYYVYGRVGDDLNIFIAKLDSAGNVIFSRQFYVGFMDNSSPFSPPSKLSLFSNGDALFAARSYGFLCLFRVSPIGNIIWGKRITSDNSPIIPQLDGCVIMPNDDTYISVDFSDSYSETTVLGLNGNGDIINDKTLKFGQWESDIASVIQWDDNSLLLAGSIREFPTDDAKLIVSKLDFVTGDIVWVKRLNTILGSVGNNRIYLDKTDNNFHLSIAGTSTFSSNLSTDFLVEFDSLGQTIRSYRTTPVEVTHTKSRINTLGQKYIGIGETFDSLQTPIKYFANFSMLELNSNFDCLLDTISETTSSYSLPQEIPPPLFLIETLDSSTVMNFQSSPAEFNVFDFCGYLQSEDNSYTEIPNIVVFPNPSTEKINFYLPKCISNEIRIIDSFGRVVSTKKIENENLELSIEHLKPGVYMYLIRSENTRTVTHGKFIVGDL